jgi:hypothetical protein
LWNSQKFPKFVPLMLAFGVFSIASPSQGQQVSQAPAAHTAYMPDQRYYSHVFTHINYLLEYGEPALAPGQPSPSVAGFYVKRVGATDEENLKFIAIAKAWKSEVDPIDSQARGIIQSIRAQTPGGKLAPGQALPAVPQTLLDLQAKRDAATLKYVATLHSQLGDDRFAALSSSLRRLTRTSFQSRSISASTTAATTNR